MWSERTSDRGFLHKPGTESVIGTYDYMGPGRIQCVVFKPHFATVIVGTIIEAKRWIEDRACFSLLDPAPVASAAPAKEVMRQVSFFIDDGTDKKENY